MIIASFQVENKLDRTWLFQESFLLADTSIEVVLAMFFFTVGNTNIQFAK